VQSYDLVAIALVAKGTDPAITRVGLFNPLDTSVKPKKKRKKTKVVASSSPPPSDTE
jgi:hypothetical protein